MLSGPDLADLIAYAQAKGAKIILAGDTSQLQAVENGGGMSCSPAPSAMPGWPNPSGSATRGNSRHLRLRDGDTTVLAEYDQHARIIGGDPEQMTDAAGAAYVSLTASGTDALLMAADHALRRELNRRIREDLITLGTVEPGPAVIIAEYNHDSGPPWPMGALAQYYCELFDYWYNELASPPNIRWFKNAMVLLLGGRSDCDMLGTNPVTDIMVESDGTWEPLDTLRICGNGMTRTGLDVRRCDVEEIWKAPLYQLGLRSQELLSDKCRSCGYRRICGGGYLPHRYRHDNGFANPSVHCADLLAVFSHIRQRIASDLEELRAATGAMAER